MPGSDDVHTVDLKIRVNIQVRKGREEGCTNLETRDFVTASEVFGVGGTALGRSTNSVLVVFANEDSGEIPKFGLSSFIRRGSLY
jgi:hypothetical protein